MKENIEKLYDFVYNLKVSSQNEETYTALDKICDKIQMLYHED